MAKNEQFYTMKEVAGILKISKATLRAYIRNGKIRCVKLSARAHRISAAELKRYVSDLQKEST